MKAHITPEENGPPLMWKEAGANNREPANTRALVVSAEAMEETRVYPDIRTIELVGERRPACQGVRHP